MVIKSRLLAALVTFVLIGTSQSFADEATETESKKVSWGKTVQCINAEGDEKRFSGSCPKGWVLINEEN